MLKLKNIKKDYISGDNNVHALKGISVNFRENEFVSILGPSGCGKTTLLNIIGGLDRYTDGDLNINGKSTKDFKDRDWDSYRNHSIGFVFQNYNLIPHQTVLSNVELALTLSGVPKSERRRRAKEALKQVGLGDQLHKKPNQMSGGQMQRVAIARALVNDPDILLADEPTGALDTETSVQIMELLKSISKDKLIIMVTHNPELAYKYSSRIIKLLDGNLIDDSDSFDDSEADKSTQKTAEQKPAKNKTKKTSMSFLTALSLSKNNLMTKKARTFLTSFAGSIGIIGIALILALSNGVQVYIDNVQSDTLSTYPLQIMETTANMDSIMTSMVDSKSNNKNHPTDKVYSQNNIGKMVDTMVKETKVNNLEKLKKHLDENKEIKDITTDIQYNYSTTLNVFSADTSDEINQVNPSTVMEDMGYSSDQLGMASSMGMMQTDVWSQMIDNDELIKKQYDVISGRLPEKWNEVMFIVNENNEVPDYVLYSLGLLDKSEITGIMQKFVAGEEIKVDSKQKSYSYDEILDLKFKLVPTTDFYKKNNNVWEDMQDDSDYMRSVVEKGDDIKIVGIVKKSKEATASSISFGIAYKSELMEHLMDKVSSSEIVKEQLDNPDTDVFTGLKFENSDDKDSDSKKSEDSSKADVSSKADNDTSSAADKKTDDSKTSDKKDSSSKNKDILTSPTISKKTAAKAPSSADNISIDKLTPEQREQLQKAQQNSKTSTDEKQSNQSASPDFSNMGNVNDLSSMSESQKKFIGSLSEEQMKLLQQMMAEQTQMASPEKSDKKSKSNYDANLTKMGYALKEKPSSINIYPKDFKAKERIVDIISDYNDSVKEEDKIEYTDMVGLMMSSVTSIINAISYVLIAFVAISLVVSSIMIGIITYISVLERTKEIGILRSIGASKKDISRVFNAETTIVGLTAGLIGIGFSYLLTIPINQIIKHLTDVPVKASIPIAGALILIAISVVLTLIAGLFPSRVAAKKDPVIALRTE